jgi:hypothetical protein
VIHGIHAAATSGKNISGHFQDNRRFGKMLVISARVPFANSHVLIKAFWISQSFRKPQLRRLRFERATVRRGCYSGCMLP